jgi:hypothetical protein
LTIWLLWQLVHKVFMPLSCSNMNWKSIPI